MGDGSLSQDEIDALLQGSDDSGDSGGADALAGLGDLAGGGGGAPAADALDGMEGLEALAGLGGAADTPAPAAGGGASASEGLDNLIDMSNLAELGDALNMGTPSPAPTTKREPKLSVQNPKENNLELLNEVLVSLTVELGRTQMYVKDINELTEGSVVELNKNVGDPVDILINNRVVAKGRIIILEEFYGVEILEFSKDYKSILQG